MNDALYILCSYIIMKEEYCENKNFIFQKNLTKQSNSNLIGISNFAFPFKLNTLEIAHMAENLREYL